MTEPATTTIAATTATTVSTPVIATLDPQIPVMHRYVLGYPEHGENADIVEYMALSEALVSHHDYDAHFQAYSADVDRRLAGDASLALEPEMQLFIVDADDEVAHREKTPARPVWRAAMCERIAGLLTAHPGGYAYDTRGGFRIIYVLAEPLLLKTVFDKEVWRASYLSWLEHLRDVFQIDGDTQCQDWTRLYRLPRVVRDHVDAVPTMEFGNPTAVGLWARSYVTPKVVEKRPSKAPSPGTATHVNVRPSAFVPTDARRDEAIRILADVWPDAGRHPVHLALAGALAHAGWDVDDIAEFTEAVAETHEPGNGDTHKRQVTAQRAVDMVLRDEPVTGRPELEKLIDAVAVRRSLDLLNVPLPPQPDEHLTQAIRDSGERKLAAKKLALAPEAPVVAPVSTTALESSLDAIAQVLAKKPNAKKKESATWIKRVRSGWLIGEGQEAFDAAATLFAYAPAGTTHEQIAALLRPCLGRAVLLELDAIMADAKRDAEAQRAQKSSYVVTEEEGLERMNDQYAWVASPGRILLSKDDGEIEFVDVDSFKITHAPTRVITVNDEGKEKPEHLGDWWLKTPGRRTYSRIDMWAPPNIAPADGYNLWQGFALEPAAGNWSLLRRHIEEIIADGNAEHAQYVLRWIAWMFQNPGKPAEALIALIGGEGLGKGSLARAIMRIFGTHATQVISADNFINKFNTHLQNCVFLFADECMASNRQHAGKLKGLVTERTILIEPKNKNTYTVSNALHILVASNNEHVLPADSDARRYVVLKVSNARKEDAAYFDALNVELEGEGPAAMLHDMLSWDLTGWHPRQIVDSSALQAQKRQSLRVAPRWAYEILAEAELPIGTDPNGKPLIAKNGWLPFRMLYEHARDAVPDSFDDKWSESSLRTALKSMGCVPSTRTNQRGWTFPPLKEARATWASNHYDPGWDDKKDWT